MKEQEAQQALTITRIKMDIGGYGQQVGEVQHDVNLLIEIVDSQAQKIEQQDADIANLLNKMALWPNTFERQAQKIAEQAKEIESLKERIAGLHAYLDEFQAVK